MAAPTPNLNLNRPNNGDDLGIWDQPVNQNWGILDSLFAGLSAASVGGTGHFHNGTPGQGPQLDHTHMTSIGSRTHSTLESEIDGLDTRLDFVEDNYCADALCGAGGGSPGGGTLQPPVHYTDNFNTLARTKIGLNDWLVSSDSSFDYMETTGRSAFMFIDPLLLGTPLTDRYAAVVKAQIPHSTAQRCTFAITRFTATQISDDDTFMMVMALMSTQQLGGTTPFIHSCGIKFVLIVTNNSGVFTITRQALVEETDGLFLVYPQDLTTGLSAAQAETYVRGIHEFSVSEDGALWYYKDRAPVWIMPPNTVSQHFGPLQDNLTSLGEPPFGSIGFGFSWTIKPLSVIDVEMSWFTMDSKDNVEEDNAPLAPSANTPRPYNDVPVEMCCSGVGPPIGSEFDVYDDGTRIETIIAKVGETAYRISSGEIINCLPVSLNPEFAPVDDPEGGSGTVDIPVFNSPPSEFLDVTSTVVGLTVTDVVVNNASTIITVEYDLDEHTEGTTFGFDVTSTYDPINTITIASAVESTNATPSILSVVWTDVEGNVVGGALEGRLLYADIYTKNADYPALGPPYPVDPGALLTFSGSGFSVMRKWFVADNHYRALLDFADVSGGEVLTPGSGTTFEIRVANTDAAYGAHEVTIFPAAPVIHWVTGSGPWPAPGSYQIDVFGYNFRNSGFTTPTLFEMQAPHVVSGVAAYVSTEQVTLDVVIMDLGGGSTGEVLLSAYHGSYSQPYRGVQFNPDFVPIVLASASTTPLDPPVEGAVTQVNLSGSGFYTEALYLTRPYFNSGSPVAVAMNRFWALEVPTTTNASFKLFVNFGEAGNDILVTMEKPGFGPVTDTTSNIVVQPTPTSDDVWSAGVYPGSSGTLLINDPGGLNNYLKGIEIYAAAGLVELVLGPTVWIDANNLSATYSIPSTATPGDAINVTITNPSGPLHTWTSHNVADLPVEILRVEWAEQPPVEGRSVVPGVVYCRNLDAAATASIASGATLSGYTVVGQTMEIEVDFAQLSGGTPFTLQIDNPTPVPSADTIGLTVMTEASPIIGVEISPPTPGVSRKIRLIGNNLYPADAYSSGMVVTLTNSANLTWDPARQTKGEWEGTIDITGTPGQRIDLSIIRPSGRIFSRTGVFTIRPLDIIPSSIIADPTSLVSARSLAVEFSGVGFDSVRSVDLVCEQPDRQPIGSSGTVPCSIVGSTSELLRVQGFMPTGNVSLTYKANFYNSVLDLLKSKTGMFTVVPSTTGPAILNKSTLWSVVNTTESVEQTLSVSLNTAVPINDKNTEIVGTNITLISVTDISPGGAPGTVFDVKFRNGAAGDEAELAFYNKNVAPEEKDVLRWLITT